MSATGLSKGMLSGLFVTKALRRSQCMPCEVPSRLEAGILFLTPFLLLSQRRTTATSTSSVPISHRGRSSESLATGKLHLMPY